VHPARNGGRHACHHLGAASGHGDEGILVELEEHSQAFPAKAAPARGVAGVLKKFE